MTSFRLLLTLLVIALLVPAAPRAQVSPVDAAVKRVADHPKLAQAMAALDRDHDRLVAEIITLTEIPAPPFKEDARAAAYLEMLRAARPHQRRARRRGQRDGRAEGHGRRRRSSPSPRTSTRCFPKART